MNSKSVSGSRDGTYLLQPWFQRPDFERTLAHAGLSEEEEILARQLRAEGFVIFDLLTDQDDAYFEAFIDSLGPDYLSGSRIQDEWRKNSYVRDLACNERVLKLLRKFYGREPFPFQTLNFPRGTEQLSHSDTVHFNSMPEHFMCGVWVALQNVTLRDGPLHYYPGSHTLPVYSLADLGVIGSAKAGYDPYTANYEPFIEQMVRDLGLTRVDLEIKRGQALIWTANLLHGGNPIVDKNSTRHSQVTHYYFEDCVYYTPMHSDLLLKKICYRNPYNILTRGRVQSRYFGERVPMEEVAAEEAAPEAGAPEAAVPRRLLLRRVLLKLLSRGGES